VLYYCRNCIFLVHENILCTFEEDTCLFYDDWALKERFLVLKSTVRKWDNTLNVGEYLIVHYLFMMKTRYYVPVIRGSPVYFRQKTASWSFGIVKIKNFNFGVFIRFN